MNNGRSDPLSHIFGCFEASSACHVLLLHALLCYLHWTTSPEVLSADRSLTQRRRGHGWPPCQNGWASWPVWYKETFFSVRRNECPSDREARMQQVLAEVLPYYLPLPKCVPRRQTKSNMSGLRYCHQAMVFHSHGV